MKKAPDTRGKLDSNAGIKKGKKRERKLSMSEFKDEVKHFNPTLKETPAAIKLRKQKKKSKGELFKDAHGYSKTMKRLMKKYGVETIEGYRLLRREKKQAAKKARKKAVPAKVVEPVKAKKKK